MKKECFASCVEINKLRTFLHMVIQLILKFLLL